MPGFKALLEVSLLLALANNKIINASPVDIDISGDVNYDPVEDSREESSVTEVTEDVSEGGIDEIKDNLASLDDHEVEIEDIEDSDGEKDHIQGLKAVDKGIMISSGISRGPGLSVSTSGDGSVTLDSSEVHAVVPGMTSTASSMFGNRVLIGDDNKMIWSDKRGEIVMVEGDKCTKDVYQKRTLVSSETMNTTDCAQVLEKIQQLKKEAQEMSDRLDKMGEEISQSVEQSTANTFYPGFPFGRRHGNSNNNYNNNSPFGNDLPFGSSNSPFGNNFPFGSNNSPFGNNFPFGSNNNPHSGNYDHTGSDGIYANNDNNGFYDTTDATGNNGNAGRASRRSRRRFSEDADALNSWI